MLRRENIYIGNVRLCNNLYAYQHCFDKQKGLSFVPYMSGEIYAGICVETVYKNAILIKVKDDKYIMLDTINTFKDELKLDFRIGLDVLKTYPTGEKMLFVDKSSLRPYYNNSFWYKNQNISVKTLKKEITGYNPHPGHIVKIK